MADEPMKQPLVGFYRTRWIGIAVRVAIPVLLTVSALLAAVEAWGG